MDNFIKSEEKLKKKKTNKIIIILESNSKTRDNDYKLKENVISVLFCQQMSRILPRQLHQGFQI